MAQSSSSGESSSSKSLFFMMAAMFCGFGILLGAGLLMASRVIHSLQLRAEGDKTTVRTPLGDFRVEKAQQVGPGLPVYPQASLVLPGGAPLHLPADDNQPQVVASTYHTNSSREYVVNWYLEHLSRNSSARIPALRTCRKSSTNPTFPTTTPLSLENAATRFAWFFSPRKNWARRSLSCVLRKHPPRLQLRRQPNLLPSRQLRNNLRRFSFVLP
jgi:hypothetical protein